MQNYFGIAIRAYTKDIVQMKKAIAAVFFTVVKQKMKRLVTICAPRDEQSWCKYWRSKITGSPYVEKKGIPRVYQR